MLTNEQKSLKPTQSHNLLVEARCARWYASMSLQLPYLYCMGN